MKTTATLKHPMHCHSNTITFPSGAVKTVWIHMVGCKCPGQFRWLNR